jgi:hypothetical protein
LDPEAVEKAAEYTFENAHMDTLMAFMFFLESTGNERLLAPVKNMLGELVDACFKANGGGASKPIGEVYQLANAAALVTCLVKDYGAKLDTALGEVSKHFGLDKRKLRNYRNNLIRRRASDIALDMYDARLREGRDLLLKAPR